MRNGMHRKYFGRSIILGSGGEREFFYPSMFLDGFIDNRVCQIPDAFLVEMLESVYFSSKKIKLGL